MRRAVAVLALIVVTNFVSMSKALSQTIPGAYVIGANALQKAFEAEQTQSDWIKIYDDDTHFDIPGGLAHIKRVKRSNADSLFLLLRSQESVAYLNKIIGSGIDVVMSFRREMYGAMTLGPGDEGSDFQAITAALGKKGRQKSIIVITPQTTYDVLVHEVVHAEQQMGGTTSALKKSLYSLAEKYQLTEKDSSLLGGVFSALIEIPAYEKQIQFIESSPYYQSDRLEAFCDSNNLETLPAKKMKEHLLTGFSPSAMPIFLQFQHTEKLLSEQGPDVQNAICDLLKQGVADSKLFKKQLLFPTCYNSTTVQTNLNQGS